MIDYNPLRSDGDSPIIAKPPHNRGGGVRSATTDCIGEAYPKNKPGCGRCRLSLCLYGLPAMIAISSMPTNMMTTTMAKTMMGAWLCFTSPAIVQAFVLPAHDTRRSFQKDRAVHSTFSSRCREPIAQVQQEIANLQDGSQQDMGIAKPTTRRARR